MGNGNGNRFPQFSTPTRAPFVTATGRPVISSTLLSVFDDSEEPEYIDEIDESFIPPRVSSTFRPRTRPTRPFRPVTSTTASPPRRPQRPRPTRPRPRPSPRPTSRPILSKENEITEAPFINQVPTTIR